MRCSVCVLVLATVVVVQGDERATAAPMFQPDFPSAVVYPSANFNAREKDISVLIIHYTASATALEALKVLTEEKPNGVSAHYLVFENGTIYQLVKENKRAWHAGLGGWREITSDMNSASIGIEIQNTGDLYADNFEPPFPQKQIDSVIALSKSIVNRHKILPGRVIGHQDHAPTRKPDPGHAFPWHQLFNAGLGVWAEPAPIVAGSSLTEGDSNQRVLEMQQHLRTLGYEVTADGVFGSDTKACVVAFQKHWRQKKFNGVADNSTLETLKRVVAAAHSLDHPSSTPSPAGCPSGWTVSASDKKKCYLYHKQDKSYSDALTACRNQHASSVLVSIQNGFENGEVRDLAANVDPWIGLNRATGSWKWDDGKSTSYLNWGNGQPATDNDCAYLLSPTGKWIVANCDIARPFICELSL